MRLANWSPGTLSLPAVPLSEENQKMSIHYAFKDLPQSSIVMGHLAVSKVHPDYFPFKVLNFILGGGGFNSRLMSEIRSNRGLAYSVGSFYRAEVEYGIFGAYCFTKSASTAECIEVMRKLIKKTQVEGITQEELEWAKNSIVNNFIFEFTSAAQIVSKRVRITYDDLPKDFLETYRERIAAVTVEQVHRVAQRYLHPDRMILVVVGDGENFEKPLSEFGEINVISLDEPVSVR